MLAGFSIDQGVGMPSCYDTQRSWLLSRVAITVIRRNDVSECCKLCSVGSRTRRRDISPAPHFVLLLGGSPDLVDKDLPRFVTQRYANRDAATRRL